jgi:hypothetical protein
MDFDGGNGGGAAAGGEGGQGAGASAADLLGGAAPAGGGDAGAAGAGTGGGAAGEGGEAGAGAGAGSGGAADPDWFNQVSADVGEGEKASLRDWLKATGVKDLNGLAKIARDNQAALRDSGRVKVPGEGASEAEIKAYHAAIGVPEDAKGYQLAEIKDAAGAPVPLNTPLLDRLAGVAHKAGVPKAAYEALVGDFVQSQLEEMATQDAAQQADAAKKVKEWGGEANAKTAAVNAGLEALGITREETLKIRAALGAGRALDIFSKLGEGVAEDVMLRGDRGAGQRFGITGAEAQRQINAMRADKATADKMMIKGTPERERYDRLLTIVGQEADRKAARGE